MPKKMYYEVIWTGVTPFGKPFEYKHRYEAWEREAAEQLIDELLKRDKVKQISLNTCEIVVDNEEDV